MVMLFAPKDRRASPVRARTQPTHSIAAGRGCRSSHSSRECEKFESLKKGFVDDLEFGLGAGSSGGRAEVCPR